MNCCRKNQCSYTKSECTCHSTWPFRHSIITWNTLYQHLYRLLVAYKRLRVPLSSVQFHGTRQQTSRRLQGSGGHFPTGEIPKLQLAGCTGHMFALHQKVRVIHEQGWLTAEHLLSKPCLAHWRHSDHVGQFKLYSAPTRLWTPC